MIKEVRKYFEALDKFLAKTKNDLRTAWLYLIKKFGLSANDATDIMYMYIQNRNDASIDDGLTM